MLVDFITILRHLL